MIFYIFPIYINNPILYYNYKAYTSVPLSNVNALVSFYPITINNAKFKDVFKELNSFTYCNIPLLTFIQNKINIRYPKGSFNKELLTQYIIDYSTKMNAQIPMLPEIFERIYYQLLENKRTNFEIGDKFIYTTELDINTTFLMTVTIQ
jgi:hypothetical protein